MKKFLLIGLIGVSTLLSAQDIKCQDYIKISDNEHKNYIKKFKRNIKLKYFSDKFTNENILYIRKIAKEVKKLKKCIYLRESRIYNVYDDRRYKAILKLSKMSLNSIEYKIYQESIKESKKAFSNFSSASLISNISHLPLIYLTVQKHKNKYLVYENRISKGKSMMYRKEIDLDNVIFKSKLQQNEYIDYLEEIKNIELKVMQKSKPIKHNLNQIVIGSNTFIITKALKNIKNYNTGKKLNQIDENQTVLLKSRKFYDNGISDYIFEYRKKLYIITDKIWVEHTSNTQN